MVLPALFTDTSVLFDSGRSAMEMLLIRFNSKNRPQGHDLIFAYITKLSQEKDFATMAMSLLCIYFFKVVSKTGPNVTSPFFSFLVFSLNSCVCGEAEREHTHFTEVKKKGGELYTYHELLFAEGGRTSGHWFTHKELGRKGHLCGDNRTSP